MHIVSQRKMSRKSRFAIVTAAAISAVVGTATGADAAVITGTSSGHGLGVDLTAIAVVDLEAGPAPAGVSGAAPAVYNLNQNTAFATVTSSVPLVAGGSVAAQAVNAAASSNVNGGAGVRQAAASGGVVNAGIGLNTLPLAGSGVNILSLDGTLSSTALVQGDYNAFTTTGTTTIENLSLRIGPTVVDLSAFVGVNVAPNTSVNLSALGIIGATLVLNEQIPSGNGVGSRGLTVNALHLTLNVAGTLGVAGDVTLGHSQASLTAVPEPATGGLIALGATAMLARRRRRRSM